MNAAPDIELILDERGTCYGSFPGVAEIAQRLKAEMRETPNWEYMTHSQHEALEMVANKLGRILNGNHKYLDSWVDIVGYMQLVVNELSAADRAGRHASEAAPKKEFPGTV